MSGLRGLGEMETQIFDDGTVLYGDGGFTDTSGVYYPPGASGTAARVNTSPVYMPQPVQPYPVTFPTSVPGYTVGTAAQSPESSVLDIIKAGGALGAQILAMVNQRDINALNVELIRAGKAPLTAAQLASLQPRVNVGVPDDQAQMMKWLVIGGLGIAAVSVLLKARR
jgi:hypothetical protein